MRGSRNGVIAKQYAFIYDFNNYTYLAAFLNALALTQADGTQLDSWASWVYDGLARYSFTSYLLGTGTVKPKLYKPVGDFAYVRTCEGTTGGSNGSYFNITDNYGTITRTGTGGVTIAINFRTSSLSSTGALKVLILAEWDIFTNRNFIMIGRSGTTNNLAITNSNNGTTAYAPVLTTTNSPLITNTFFTFIFRCTSNKMDICYNVGTTKYVDSMALDPALAKDWTYNVTTSRFYIGGNYNGGNTYQLMPMDIRQFLFYKRYLSDTERDVIYDNITTQYALAAG